MLLPLPKLDPHKSWSFFAERNMSQKVSGDYVDAHLTEKGDLFLITADVMGKGISAAFLAAMIRTAFHINTESKKI